MDENDIRNWLIDNRYTAYEIGKHVDLSLQGIQNFLNGDRNPQRKTLQKLEYFVTNEIEKAANTSKLAAVKETPSKYGTVTNTEIFEAIQDLATALGQNGILLSDMLSKTYENTKHLIKSTNRIDRNLINIANNNLGNKLNS